jgi:hypothetical protein
MLKRKLLIVITTIVGIGFLTGCVAQKNYTPTKTNLEIQSIQKQEFSAKYKTAFTSTLSALQDKGYAVESANADTGLITAVGYKRSSMLFFGDSIEYIKATAFVEIMPSGKASIRLNFINHQEISGSYGSKDGNSVPIEDSKFYRVMFESIKKAIAVRTSK